MRVAVTGANGQLGCDICEAFKANGHDVLGLSHADIEIEDFSKSMTILQELNPDIIVNTAAKHNVDGCEEEIDEAFAVNGMGARNLAVVSNKLESKFIHISTDYVFDGRKREPYVESDCPLPLNVYGNSKLCGENFVRTIANRYFVVRVSAIYGENPCRAKGGMNFIQLMLHLARQGRSIRVVDDEIVSPTYTLDIATQIVELVKSEHYDVYHMTSQGSCSWYEFAEEIFRMAKVEARVAKADPDEFPTKAQRPKYSVLNNHNLKSIGLDMMPDWKDAVERYLTRVMKG